MKTVIHPPCPPGWGCIPETAFLQRHGVPNRLTNQYTKLKTNQAIVLVKISILDMTDTFLPFFVGPTKCNTFLYGVNVNKKVLEHTVYSIKNMSRVALEQIL